MGQNRCFAQKSKSYYPNRLSARQSIAGRADAEFDVLAIIVAHHFNDELKSKNLVAAHDEKLPKMILTYGTLSMPKREEFCCEIDADDGSLWKVKRIRTFDEIPDEKLEKSLF